MRFNRRQWISGAVATGAAVSTQAAAQQNNAPAQIAPLARPATGNIRVAFLVDSFTNIIDLAGPWETFGSGGDDSQRFELFTVAPVKTNVTYEGTKVEADYSLDEAPQPHVIVMGAQSGAVEPGDTTSAKVAWLRRVEGGADIVMSVCTGAFLLARTGMLDQRVATTHHNFYDDFERKFPSVRLVRDRRFVDNGKFVSGGGLTSGIDAALHIVARYFGEQRAAQTAAYLEHDSDGWRTGLRQSA